jgi:OPA family glycerol-3-phosphate transporter-like MFS transporter
MTTAALTNHLPPAMRTWRMRVFVSTWLCYAGFYFCRRPFSIAKAAIGTELHWQATDLAAVYAAYLVAYTVGQFASSAIGPRLGPRNMLLGGMALSIACSVAFGFTDSLWWFIALMSVNGLAQATGWSNTVGTMANWFRREERGTVMGIWATNFQVGGVASAGLAAWMLPHLGFRFAFWSGAAVLAGVAAVVYFWQRNKPEDVGLPALIDDQEPTVSADEPIPKWSRSTWITVLLIGFAYFGMKFIRYALWSWAPFFLEKNLHLKGDNAGYVSTLFDLCGIVGVVVTGFLSDKIFRGRRALVSFLMILGVCAATLLLFTVGAQSVLGFAISIGLIGFTLYGPDALLTGAGAMDVGGGRGAVRASGIISGIGSAGSVVQELVIGKMYVSGNGSIAPILATLLGSAVFTAACVGAIVVRNARGSSDM